MMKRFEPFLKLYKRDLNFVSFQFHSSLNRVLKLYKGIYKDIYQGIYKGSLQWKKLKIFSPLPSFIIFSLKNLKGSEISKKIKIARANFIESGLCSNDLKQRNAESADVFLARAKFSRLIIIRAGLLTGYQQM